jgi:hypothetical protein
LPRKLKTIDPPAKTELFSRTNRRKLNTVGAIASEQGKIYRAAASGTIETGEAMRLSCILRELRAALEAAQAAAVVDMPAGGFTSDLICLSVPKGSVVDSAGNVRTPSGDRVDLQPLEPYPASPSLEMLTDQTVSFEPLPVIEKIADDKIAVLHPHRRRDDGPPGAA